MPTSIIYALLLISISCTVASRDVNSSYLPTTVRAAQTFAACRQASDCREGLQCFTLHDSVECNRFDLDCICVPDPLQPCLLTSGCRDGEICANTAFFFLNICISKDNDVTPGQIAEASFPTKAGVLYMDFCENEAGASRCAGLASCRSVSIGDSRSCFIRERPCYCYMDRHQPCLKDSNCILDEVCAEMPRGQYPFCVSPVVEQDRLSLSAASMPDNTMGFSLDPCETNEDCKGTRECREVVATGSELTDDACTGRFTCACLQFDNNTRFPGNGIQLCASSSECEKGEVCARGTAFGNSTACISKDFADTFRMAVQVDAEEEEVTAEEENNETEGQVCIDAEALEDMTSAELVYSSHVTAMVLCDEYGSCATRGHVVVWKGQAMMMGSYCRKVGCLERVIQVNSPRYAMGKKVASKTDGLQYTTFAARYESRIEEAVMATAVRFGL